MDHPASQLILFMNGKTGFVVVLGVIALGFIAGVYAGVNSVPDDDSFYAACPVSLEQIIQSAAGDVYNYEAEINFKEPKSYYIVSYSVKGDSIFAPVLNDVPTSLLDEQENIALQRSVWDVYANLIPAENRQMVTRFQVFSDGYSNTLAAVSPSYEDPSMWYLEVDIADLDDQEALLFTLIHEYAHLLTLNETQIVPDVELALDYDLDLLTEKAAACETYFTGLGCSQPGSYIQAFYDRFWTGINDEWVQADTLQYKGNDIAYYNALYTFYKKYQSQFVDDYAVTHPTEDIAESFAYFVFSPTPHGDTVRDQKLLFFYEYPELIRLREHILKATCSMTE